MGNGFAMIKTAYKRNIIIIIIIITIIIIIQIFNIVLNGVSVIIDLLFCLLNSTDNFSLFVALSLLKLFLLIL